MLISLLFLSISLRADRILVDADFITSLKSGRSQFVILSIQRIPFVLSLSAGNILKVFLMNVTVSLSINVITTVNLPIILFARLDVYEFANRILSGSFSK